MKKGGKLVFISKRTLNQIEKGKQNLLRTIFEKAPNTVVTSLYRVETAEETQSPINLLYIYNDELPDKDEDNQIAFIQRALAHIDCRLPDDEGKSADAQDQIEISKEDIVCIDYHPANVDALASFGVKAFCALQPQGDSSLYQNIAQVLGVDYHHAVYSVVNENRRIFGLLHDSSLSYSEHQPDKRLIDDKTFQLFAEYIKKKEVDYFHNGTEVLDFQEVADKIRESLANDDEKNNFKDTLEKSVLVERKYAFSVMHPVKSIYKSTLEVLLDTVKQKDRHGRSESQMLDLQLEYQLLNPSQIQLRADSFNDPIKFAQDLTHAISRFEILYMQTRGEQKSNLLKKLTQEIKKYIQKNELGFNSHVNTIKSVIIQSIDARLLYDKEKLNELTKYQLTINEEKNVNHYVEEWLKDGVFLKFEKAYLATENDIEKFKLKKMLNKQLKDYFILHPTTNSHFKDHIDSILDYIVKAIQERALPLNAGWHPEYTKKREQGESSNSSADANLGAALGTLSIETRDKSVVCS